MSPRIPPLSTISEGANGENPTVPLRRVQTGCPHGVPYQAWGPSRPRQDYPAKASEQVFYDPRSDTFDQCGISLTDNESLSEYSRTTPRSAMSSPSSQPYSFFTRLMLLIGAGAGLDVIDLLAGTRRQFADALLAAAESPADVSSPKREQPQHMRPRPRSVHFNTGFHLTARQNAVTCPANVTVCPRQQSSDSSSSSSSPTPSFAFMRHAPTPPRRKQSASPASSRSRISFTDVDSSAPVSAAAAAVHNMTLLCDEPAFIADGVQRSSTDFSATVTTPKPDSAGKQISYLCSLAQKGCQLLMQTNTLLRNELSLWPISPSSYLRDMLHLIHTHDQSPQPFQQSEARRFAATLLWVSCYPPPPNPDIPELMITPEHETMLERVRSLLRPLTGLTPQELNELGEIVANW